MDFGLIFILILWTGLSPNFHPNTIDYGFWPNFKVAEQFSSIQVLVKIKKF